MKTFIFDFLGIEDAISELPPELYASLGNLILIMKALGIVFIIYLIFLIVNSYLNIRRGIRIKKIDRVVGEINDKLDMLIRKRHKETHKRTLKNEDSKKSKKK